MHTQTVVGHVSKSKREAAQRSPMAIPKPSASPEELFSIVFETHYKNVLAYVARRADSDVVDDVCNEVFMIAWRRWNHIQHGEQVLPWLYKTASNVLRNKRRSQGRHLRLIQRIKKEPAPSLEENEISADLQRAIQGLSEKDREVLLLVAWEDLRYSEVAQVLDCSVNAVGLKVHRAKKKLAKVFASQMKERTT